MVLIKQDIGILYSWRQRILQAFWLSGRGQFLYYTNLQLKEIFNFFFNIQILKLTYLIKDLLFTKWKFMAKNIISDGDSIDLPLSLTFECPKKYTAIKKCTNKCMQLNLIDFYKKCLYVQLNVILYTTVYTHFVIFQVFRISMPCNHSLNICNAKRRYPVLYLAKLFNTLFRNWHQLT